MKKLAYIFLVCAIPIGAYAQDTPVNGRNVDKVDSLTQVVSELSSKVQKVEDDKRNEAVWKKRSRYFYIAYGKNQLKDNSNKLSSDYSFAMISGRTYYLHKRPLGGMVKFGIDWNFADVNFAKYPDLTPVKVSNDQLDPELAETFDLAPMQIDLGMGIGLSCTVNPVNHLKAGIYFHVTPSYSMVLQNEELHSSYATFFNFGLHASYKAISLAFEMRRSFPVKYDNLVLSAPEEGSMDSNDSFVDPFQAFSENTKNMSCRIMLGFRF